MQYRMRFALILCLSNLTSHTSASCEDKESNSYWSEEEQECVPYFEYVCSTLEDTPVNAGERESIRTLLFIENSNDCKEVADRLQRRIVLELHNPRFRVLTPLKDCANLEILDLLNTSVDDETLQDLPKLPNLETLVLTNTFVEKAETIAKLVQIQPKLRRIYMVNAPFWIMREMKSVMQEYPELTIVF